jgi:hypothetical protein
LYQALYFQAVDNPKALQPDLVNVLLADVAAQVYAGNSKASPATVEKDLAALRSAFAEARNAQAPASAGSGLPSFGPTLVPQLTGAIGVMAAFAKSQGAGIIGPAVRSVGTSIYGAYLKTSIATGIGFSTGYAGFSDRSLYNAGDLNASGFHALVSGPAIQRAVACGQANAACATVENSLLTPVVRTGLNQKAGVSVAGTPAQQEAVDPTLVKMLSKLKLKLNADGSLTLPSGAGNKLLLAAGNLNVSVTSTLGGDVKQLVAATGDPSDPTDVSTQADTDLADALPQYEDALTGTVFSDSLVNRVPTGTGNPTPIMDGSAPSQGMINFLQAIWGDRQPQGQEILGDLFGLAVDVCTEQWSDAIGNVFSLIGTLFGGGTQPDEAFMLAQQTDKMIKEVFDDLTSDLNVIEGSIVQLGQGIQHVQASLNDMFKAMEQGFSDIDFTNHEVLAGLTSVELTLGQLQYQADLTDGDVVAFGQGEVQTQIQGTINQCLDRTARNLAPLDFSEFSDCASQFKTEAQTSASNDVVEFSTPPPAAPGNGDFSSDGTVATTLAAHGLDPAKDLSYLLSILHGWYGLGSDPGALNPSLVNPGVWSEVALGYRELLDEYPQFSAGPEPDLTSIEAPGQQVTNLISALQQVDPSTGTNAAVQQFTGNYGAAFKRLIADINQHQVGFPTDQTGADNGYGTPSDQSWDGYYPLGGLDQFPGGTDPVQQVSSFAACGGGDPVNLFNPEVWEQGVILPKSWFLLFHLVGYSDGSLQPLDSPICYTYTATPVPNPGCIRSDGTQCPTFDETGTLDVQFMGTDGVAHSFHHFQLGTTRVTCQGTGSCPPDTAGEFFNRLLLITKPLSGFSSLETLLSNVGGNTQLATTDVLDSEATQILAAGAPQVYKWDVAGLTQPNVDDHATLAADAGNLTGAFELIQLAAQTLVPSASLGNQALSDLLYGQDQLPTSLTGPNNALTIILALENGTGTQTVDQYSDAQLGRLTQLATLLDAALADQQAAGPSAGAAAHAKAGGPPASTTATAEAPALTYGVLAQLVTGALLDTDTVTVRSPGKLTTSQGTTVFRQLTAASTAKARITSWTATGLPPGLSINGKTGKITGKPTRTGTFSVTVKATDTVGSSVHNSGQAKFTWIISKH